MTAAAVRSEQVRSLYRNSAPVLLANVLIAAVVVGTLWPSGPRPALLPLVARTMAIGDSLHLAMGSMTALYGVLLTAVARNTHRFIGEAFRLRFQNEALVQRLSEAQGSLEETNRTLEQRVRERTA